MEICFNCIIRRVQSRVWNVVQLNQSTLVALLVLLGPGGGGGGPPPEPPIWHAWPSPISRGTPWVDSGTLMKLLSPRRHDFFQLGIQGYGMSQHK